MIRLTLVLLLSVALAAFTYLYLERLGRRSAVPLACRALAWSALALLLLNLSCPAPGAPARPLVLLDGSLSFTAPGGRWREALDSARRWGEVRLFGDERPGGDSLPDRGRSLLGPALIAASASDRPVLAVTDGEIEDAPELPPDLVARTGVRLFPRAPVPDVAITRVSGPARITSGDSLTIEAEIQSVGEPRPDSVVVAVEANQRSLARRVVRLSGGAGRVRLTAGSGALGPGDHVLHVLLAGHHDAEPRTDLRLHVLTVVPTPGIVLLAAPADWDGRFLYRTLKEVAQLPIRGYARLERDRWRSLQDLAPVGAEQVRQAAARADLVILKGDPGGIAQGLRARGIWRWPSGETREGEPTAGDWYLGATGGSPLDAAFAGFPLDSFPPAIQLTPIRPDDGDWVALSAQEGRRGPRWPVVIGRETGKTRQITVLADGLWRWAFRGGSSEQSYRAWVAAAVSWLLAGADTAQGLARPARPVVPNGRPLVFEWTGHGAPRAVAVQWSGTVAAPATADTLRFDGAGRAPLWLAPGEYRYRLAGGGAGTVAIESYSDELLPRPVALAAREARVRPARGRRSARDWPWLFGICVLALAGEWLARRRLGLR